MKRASRAAIHFFFWALIEDWQKQSRLKQMIAIWSLLALPATIGFAARRDNALPGTPPNLWVSVAYPHDQYGKCHIVAEQALWYVRCLLV